MEEMDIRTVKGGHLGHAQHRVKMLGQKYGNVETKCVNLSLKWTLNVRGKTSFSFFSGRTDGGAVLPKRGNSNMLARHFGKLEKPNSLFPHRLKVHSGAGNIEREVNSRGMEGYAREIINRAGLITAFLHTGCQYGKAPKTPVQPYPSIFS